ncbi:hypothetical protein ACA910_003417 [Epithemia clementina (nom. ined.)]
MIANATTDAAATVSTTTESEPPEGGEEERLGMLNLIQQYLDSGNRSYQCQEPTDAGSQVLLLNLTGDHSSYRTFIDVKAHQDRMFVFIESPVKAPERSRPACAELLMRINYSLVLGNFEIDFRDGEIRYRMAVDVEGSHLSLSMIETNIMVSAATMDRYFPVMMTVIYGNKAPVEALEEVRNPTLAALALSSGTSSPQ